MSAPKQEGRIGAASTKLELLAEIARLRAQLEAQSDAEGMLASCTDLANSWARESGVAEAERESDLKALIDRLWSHWTLRLEAQSRDAARLVKIMRGIVEEARGKLTCSSLNCGHEDCKDYRGDEFRRWDAAIAKLDAAMAAKGDA